MGWFRRKKEEPIADDEWSTGPLGAAAPAAQPTPAARGVTFLDDGGIHLNVGSVEEAKLAIKQLKLRKKEYANLKRAVNQELAQLNAARRQQTARQGSMVRGGGNLGQTVRAFQRVSRDADRRQHAANLAPLEARKAAIDAAMLNIDQAVTAVEGYILEQQGRG